MLIESNIFIILQETNVSKDVRQTKISTRI